MRRKQTTVGNGFCDLLSGTGVVCGAFKEQGYNVIANDVQYYSYVVTKHIAENGDNLDRERCSDLIGRLNQLDGVEGFIYKNYSYEGTQGQEFRRMYFSEHNAKKCDAVRMTIEKWFVDGEINENEYFSFLRLLSTVSTNTPIPLPYTARILKN